MLTECKGDPSMDALSSCFAFPPSTSSPLQFLRHSRPFPYPRPAPVPKIATAAKLADPSKVSSAPSLSGLCPNAFDDIIINFVDPPLRPSVDPRFVLASNFAPVEELPPTKCEVIYGSLPSCLDGAYIHNGPNPQFLPRCPNHFSTATLCCIPFEHLKVRPSLKTETVSRQPIAIRNLEMAVINPAYMRKKNMFVYAAVGDPMPKLTGTVKLDVFQKKQRKRKTGVQAHRGGAIFGAKEPYNAEAEEDDGYVVRYDHEEKTGKSKFVVMDAKSAELEISAGVGTSPATDFMDY